MATDEIEYLNDVMLEQHQDSTQIDTPAEDIERMREIQKAHAMDEQILFNVAELQKHSAEYRINAKNKTLFRVIADNRKTLERRIIPLLEMFRVENNYFSLI
jgi:hypothetical protein